MKTKHTESHYLFSGFLDFLNNYVNTYHMLGFLCAIFGISFFFPAVTLLIIAFGLVSSSVLILFHIFQEYKLCKKQINDEEVYSKLNEENNTLIAELKKEDENLRIAEESFEVEKTRKKALKIIKKTLSYFEENKENEYSLKYEEKKEIIQIIENINDKGLKKESIINLMKKFNEKTKKHFSNNDMDLSYKKFFEKNHIKPHPKKSLKINNLSNSSSKINIPSSKVLAINTTMQTTILFISTIAFISTFILGVAPAAFLISIPLVIVGISLGAILLGGIVGMLASYFYKTKVVPQLERREYLREKNQFFKLNIEKSKTNIDSTKKLIGAEERSKKLIMKSNDSLYKKISKSFTSFTKKDKPREENNAYISHNIKAVIKSSSPLHTNPSFVDNVNKETGKEKELITGYGFNSVSVANLNL